MIRQTLPLDSKTRAARLTKHRIQIWTNNIFSAKGNCTAARRRTDGSPARSHMPRLARHSLNNSTCWTNDKGSSHSFRQFSTVMMQQRIIPARWTGRVAQQLLDGLDKCQKQMDGKRGWTRNTNGLRVGLVRKIGNSAGNWCRLMHQQVKNRARKHAKQGEVETKPNQQLQTAFVKRCFMKTTSAKTSLLHFLCSILHNQWAEFTKRVCPSDSLCFSGLL